MNRTARGLAPLTLLLALLVALVVTGCSSSGSDDSDSGAEEPAAAVEDVGGDAGGDADMAPPDEAADAQLSEAGDAPAEKEAPDQPTDPVFSRAVIRKGSVEMQSKDVGRAQIEVQKIVDRYAGEVTEEQTESDHDDGEPAYARMVLRVPSTDFDRTVVALKKVGEHPTVNTTEEDVTTKVIDVQTRLTAQRRSIARITVLFDQAESIRDIMSVEAELSRRQADLDALERKRAYLLGQSSMSTVTVSIDRVPEKKAAAAKSDDNSFVAGLRAGWDALSAFASGLATVAGALLPWAVVLALLGIPTLLLVRSLRRRAPVVATEEAGQASE